MRLLSSQGEPDILIPTDALPAARTRLQCCLPMTTTIRNVLGGRSLSSPLSPRSIERKAHVMCFEWHRHAFLTLCINACVYC